MTLIPAPAGALLLAALLLAAPLAAPAHAQQAAPADAAAMPGTADPAKVTGGTYQVDPNHTQVRWTVNHLGISPLSGMFGEIGGTLILDPKNPNASRVEITIPMSGLTVTSRGFARHLASADFFDTSRFPDATFRSTRVEASGTRATITGDLTLHNVTRPVVLQATFFGAGTNPMDKAENIGFTATAEVRRSEFGLGHGAPVVSDRVALEIVGAFVRK